MATKSLFDHHQHCDHLADPLACEVLEIAGLINADDVILHILREAVVVIVIQRGLMSLTIRRVSLNDRGGTPPPNGRLTIWKDRS